MNSPTRELEGDNWVSEYLRKNESILRSKSYDFGVRIVRLSQFLVSEHKEYVLSDRFFGPELLLGH